MNVKFQKNLSLWGCEKIKFAAAIVVEDFGRMSVAP